MRIKRSIDIEDTIREALAEHVAVYVRPLPASYSLPHVQIQQVGGADVNTIDYFEVSMDARAKTEAEALLTLRNAVGILRAVAESQKTPIAYVTVNSSGSWGVDPVRPDLAMCSARVRVVAHLEEAEV